MRYTRSVLIASRSPWQRGQCLHGGETGVGWGETNQQPGTELATKRAEAVSTEMKKECAAGNENKPALELCFGLGWVIKMKESNQLSTSKIQQPREFTMRANQQ